MLDNMVAKKDFIFSTDSYYQDSIKTPERMRRGYSPIFIVDGPATRKPADLKLFLVNEDNKTHNCVSCYCEFGEARRLERCGFALVVVEEKAYQLTSSDGEARTHAYSFLFSYIYVHSCFSVSNIGVCQGNPRTQIDSRRDGHSSFVLSQVRCTYGIQVGCCTDP